MTLKYMQTSLKELPKGKIELTIELTTEEYQPFLHSAAKTISEKSSIPGFRPGHASYDIVKQRVGEGSLWQEALEPAIKATLGKAIDEHGLTTVGSPEVDVTKLAPGNPVVYTAIVSVLPEVTLPDLTTVSVTAKPVVIDEEKIAKGLADLQKMNAIEKPVERPIEKGDKAVINFATFLDNIPIEHGEQLGYEIVVGEGSFIPGFEDQLIGMKIDEKKSFPLAFPATYHQKNLAGKTADFTVTITGVKTIELPALTDEFAKNVGPFTDLTALKTQLTEKIRHEAEEEERHRQEDELFEKLIAAAKFSEIPDLLLDSEAHKMLDEIERNITSQGISFEDYLTHLKKNRDQLLLDFAPQAVKRIKSALITRSIAKKDAITVNDHEVETEIQAVLAAYAGAPDLEKQLSTPEYRQYLRNVIVSRKTIDHLKKIVVK